MAGGMKQLAKDTAIYGLSTILGRFLNWLLVSLHTRTLPDLSDYGVVTNLYGWTALLLVLLVCGMETGLFRFINRKDEQEPMRVYSTTLYTVASLSLLFLAAVFLFLNPVNRALGYDAHPEYVGMMAAIVAVDAFCCVPFAYLRYRGKAARFAVIKLLNIALNIALNIFFLLVCPRIHTVHPEWIDWFYKADYGVGYIFVANVFTTALTFILLLPDMLPGFRARMDWQRLKKIFNYSFPILILGVAGVFNQAADKILFPFMFEDHDYANTQLGIYGACFKIAVVMMMFIQAFRYAYEPFIFAKNRDKDNRTAYAEAMKYFIIFALAIFLGVMFYLDVLKHLIDSAYYDGLIVVPIVMLGELFFGIYFNLSVWYKLTDRTVWGAVFSIIGCILTVAVIVFFVPRYGFVACAYASLISNLAMMALSYFIGRKKYPVAYDLRSALLYGLVAAGLYAAGMIPQVEPMWLRLAYRTVLLALFAAFTIKRDFPSWNTRIRNGIVKKTQGFKY
ncbi:MAG: polysaccharide biosynthesis C-terminal domain-containing protein [Tannerella sp.]|jgi:O-antigen/teichoic acid export membrane protein|nr:polysaccharide biosynthesis C-terminal domain-containing protein [Tannerella sp.]